MYAIIRSGGKQYRVAQGETLFVERDVLSNAAARWPAVQFRVRNVAVQVVTVVALSYAFLLEGAVLTETVFAWPGFGRYLTNALLAGDMNAVVGCTILIGVIFIGINIVCDLLYRVFDPRTR